MMGIRGVHIRGEHLRLPDYEDKLPTFEIFSDDDWADGGLSQINRNGFGHIAFEVDDVTAMLEKLLDAGGGQFGKQIVADCLNNVVATFFYATDPEGNIVELQNWGHPIRLQCQARLTYGLNLSETILPFKTWDGGFVHHLLAVSIST